MRNEMLRLSVEKNFQNPREFARYTNISEKKIRKMLDGKYIPKVSEASAIAGALRISVTEVAKFF